MVQDKVKKLKAASLIEITITMGMLAIFAFVMMPVTIQQLRIGNVVTTAKDATSQVFLYQQNAYSGKNSKSYGIAYTANNYTLFIGTSLATAEQTILVDLPNGTSFNPINLSNGASEIVFSSGNFRPSAYGTIRLTDGTNSHVIDINAEGLIHEYSL